MCRVSQAEGLRHMPVVGWFQGLSAYTYSYVGIYIYICIHMYI